MPASVYTTRASLEEAGIQTSAFTASRVNTLIRRASAIIDRVTGQRFNPISETINLDGNDRVQIHRPDLLPIISVSSILVSIDKPTRRGQVLNGGLSALVAPVPTWFSQALEWFDFTDNAWSLVPEPTPRFIEATASIFPGGAANIAVAGVFGWLEPSSKKTFSTTIANDSSITTNGTSTTLTSVTGLELRDVLVAGNIHLIVKSISGSIVTFDDVSGALTSALPAGTAVKAWGAVPYAIEEACNLLVQRMVARQAAWEQGTSFDPAMLRREKTDNYEWEAFSPSQYAGDTSSGYFTGVPEVDQILRDYSAPAYAGFA